MKDVKAEKTVRVTKGDGVANPMASAVQAWIDAGWKRSPTKSDK